MTEEQKNPQDNPNAEEPRSEDAPQNTDPERDDAQDPTPEPQAPPLEQQVNELRDKYMRLAADFENYKKRFHRELDRMRRDDQQRMISDWLDVLDSMDRALKMSDPSENPWYDGTKATHRQMLEVLKRRGIKPIETEGQRFDPHLHEAISAVPNPDMEDGEILFTERAGYLYPDGSVLRPARVVVVRQPS